MADIQMTRGGSRSAADARLNMGSLSVLDQPGEPLGARLKLNSIGRASRCLLSRHSSALKSLSVLG